MPALAVGDAAAVTILHVSQVAKMVGLDAPPGVDAVRYAWETLSVLRGWLAHLETIDESLMGEQVTPRRPFTPRVLAVNVFNPFGMMPGAWETGEFDWQPEGDLARAEELGSTENVIRFCRDVYADWSDFVLGHEDEIASEDRAVRTSRGDVMYSQLLETQRWHSSVHYRQIVEWLRARGVVLSGAFSLDTLTDLQLPESVF